MSRKLVLLLGAAVLAASCGDANLEGECRVAMRSPSLSVVGIEVRTYGGYCRVATRGDTLLVYPAPRRSPNE